jgi:hypothetical protein
MLQQTHFIYAVSAAFVLWFQRVGLINDFINKSVNVSALYNCYPQSLRTVPNIICVNDLFSPSIHE